MWWSMLAVELSVRDFDSHNTFCASDLVCVCARAFLCAWLSVSFSQCIPFDPSATNVTLHVSWSHYKCVIEERINKMKLDDKNYKTADKVNLSATRVDTCEFRGMRPFASMSLNVKPRGIYREVPSQNPRGFCFQRLHSYLLTFGFLCSACGKSHATAQNDKLTVRCNRGPRACNKL
jgi:hypothetical protein